MVGVIIAQILILVIVAVIIGIAIYHKGVNDERRESFKAREGNGADTSVNASTCVYGGGAKGITERSGKD